MAGMSRSRTNRATRSQDQRSSCRASDHHAAPTRRQGWPPETARRSVGRLAVASAAFPTQPSSTESRRLALDRSRIRPAIPGPVPHGRPGRRPARAAGLARREPAHRRGSARRRRARARQRDHPHRYPGRRGLRRARLHRADHAGRARPAGVGGRRAAHRRDARRRRGRGPGPDRRVAGRGAQPGHPVPARQDDPAQDAEPEALRRRDRRAHHRVRDRPGRHRQDLPGHGQGRAGAAGQAGQPDHPDPAGGGGGGAAGLPARHPVREDRPVPAPALRRAARHDRPGVDPQADGRRHHRGGAAGLHAGSDAERRVHHPGRGAEHHARADEDVPDPARASAPRSWSPGTSRRSTCPAAPGPG